MKTNDDLSFLALFSFISVWFCSNSCPVVAAEKNHIPDKNLAKYVVDHLDVTSFRSSIGPRRETGKVTFNDYGFKPVKVSDTQALLKDKGWVFFIRVLRHTGDSITICLVDKAENGGTYYAQKCLLLKTAKSGSNLIASTKSIRDKRCDEFAK